MTKDERIDIAINRYLKAGAIGTLNHIMRFGKTTEGCLIAERFRRKFEDEIIIAVPSVAVRDEWLTTLSDFEIDNLRVLTANEILNLDRISVGLLIIDELHKFVSDNRLNIVNGNIISYTYNLGLTGTYPFGNKIIEKHFPIVDTITDKEAIDNGWISNFIEYNVPLELTNADKANYVKYSTKMYEISSTFRGLSNILINKDGTSFFNNDLDLILSCYSGKFVKDVGHIESKHIREAVAVKMGWMPELDLTFERNIDIDKYWNPDNIKERAVEYYQAMRKRNEIHNINEVKLKAVLQICEKFKGKNTLIFNESTMFADTIADSLNSYFKDGKAISYHSGVKGKPLISFIDGEYFKFSNGKIKTFGKEKQLRYIKSMLKIGLYDTIVTAKALDEGFNAETIEIIITTSGTANPMQYSQRNARGKTVDKYNKDKVTYIFNLFFDDFGFLLEGEHKHFYSRDKKKLDIRQGNSKAITLNLSEFIENY